MKPKQTETDDIPGAVRTYKAIREDYRHDGSVFNAEPDRVRIVKEIIEHRLNQVDRTLIILYADCGSYRELGKRLGLSHTTIGQEIRRIRQHIVSEYRKIRTEEQLKQL